MNLLVVILKKIDVINDLCKELVEVGVQGGTIIDATGMASVIENMEDLPIFSIIKKIIAEEDRDIAKTMLFVMNDEELEKAKKVIRKVVKLDSPNSGIMFVVPVSFVEGI